MVKTLHISTGHIVTQGEGNIVSDMDGEKVMLSIENGKYYNLGEMGGVIWDLIKIPTSINQLVNTLLSQYEVKKSECEEQVMTFLNMLHDEGLIKVEEA
ncbi:lasso peptide biosynthesis PqqD family chaperone [Metabacillus rhizolycopersici]|uniref:Lasso peptide biosynthesis PqqD family chaperone n=1 Tax=Metabacillus rhizolycopersici TaxID=2875709 RepID=A0ABS7UN06_9BACI|nr:lasso peptide biosynthesis PqqD family chaperone [Metabacillus rhizolycopersici]MBZ5749683.1 lasso peptide biosynthesis PqqD family chaperone [Metabacillus rhizolycopersici]